MPRKGSVGSCLSILAVRDYCAITRCSIPDQQASLELVTEALVNVIESVTMSVNVEIVVMTGLMKVNEETVVETVVVSHSAVSWAVRPWHALL